MQAFTIDIGWKENFQLSIMVLAMPIFSVIKIMLVKKKDDSIIKKCFL